MVPERSLDDVSNPSKLALPFSLHPSGFACWYSETAGKNLIRQQPCPVCKRVAGHKTTCEFYNYDAAKTGRSSRPKLYDAAAVLWAKEQHKNFLTFTLPSRPGKKFYQDSHSCQDTGDLAIGKKWSMLLEAWATRTKRSGSKLSYVWVSEAQQQRKEKYGGIGDIHYHLVCNQQIKNDQRKVVNLELLNYLQDGWCKLLGTYSNNCLHADPLPDGINSIPAYVSKYFNKGSQRKILSRQFQASQDLSRFKPVSITALPSDLQPITTTIATMPNGHEVSIHYFNTREILEQYGPAMLSQGDFEPTRMDKNFQPARIIDRAIKRQRVSLGLSYSM